MKRFKDVYSGSDILEEIYTIKDFPVFCGQSDNKNIFRSHMSFCISRYGVIQLGELIPLDILYSHSHNDAYGKTWDLHNIAFSEFLKQYIRNKRVVEYGSGSGKICEMSSEFTDTWVMVDLNPINKTLNKNVSSIKCNASEYFDIYDVYIHSHFLEHLYEPYKFIRHMRKCQIGSMQCFSIPNQKSMMENGFTNSVNFEHTVVLDQEYVESTYLQSGFILKEKMLYGDHSIFYCFERIAYTNQNSIFFKEDNLYKRNKELLLGYIENINKKANNANDIVGNECYNILYAHLFTQFMFELGLSCKNCVNILDNSELKIGKELYGYPNIKIESPQNANKNLVTIVPSSTYDSEIKQQLDMLGFKNVRFI